MKKGDATLMGAGRRLVAIDPTTKQVTAVAERIDGKRFNAPNDLVLDATGGIWFTDPAYGRAPEELEIGQEAVYWVSPDRTTVTRVADSLRRPNGIAFSPDGKTLYVADRDGDVTYAYPRASRPTCSPEIERMWIVPVTRKSSVSSRGRASRRPRSRAAPRICSAKDCSARPSMPALSRGSAANMP